MVELADIFRRYGPDYIDRFGSKMLPSHHRALQDIIACRTEQMGGHLYCCENPDCEHIIYAYHSCGNRSCPKCGQDKTQRWIEKQHNLLLPTHYFLVTFTLPSELRPMARSKQKVVYDLLFKSAATALQKLAKDRRFVGGDIGMMGGLHTWQRDMGYHPHVHFIVPGGGLSPDRSQWLPSKADFFVPVEALSLIFRAKFRDALKKTDLFDSVPSRIWKKDWVVHCKPLGNGNSALKYLAPYIYRVAITNNRVEKLENDQVSFRFKNSDTDQWQTTTLPAPENLSTAFCNTCCRKTSSKSAITDFYLLIKETCWRLPNTCWMTTAAQKSSRWPANNIYARIAGQNCAGLYLCPK